MNNETSPHLKSLLALSIAILLMQAAMMYQLQNLIHQVSNDTYSLGVQAGRQAATMDIMTSVVPVGEAPATVKDEAGNEFATDGFTYVIIKPKR